MIKTGDIVISKAGHDEGRLYVVTALLSGDFVLVCDGRYRKVDNPKTKRIKHLKKIAEGEKAFILIENGELTDASLVCELKSIAKQSISCGQ